MKKNILGLLLICCMGLFTSCSDDDNNGIDAGQMHVSAVLPASITAGGAEDIVGHKLRCILELWTKGEVSQPAYRNEVVVEPSAETAAISFDLAVDAGTYDCLMWVDYVDGTVAAAGRSEDGAICYADKYYDTSDLRNVAIKEMSSLINNEAADAFYYSGEVSKKSGEALVLQPQMVRPFAKVSVLEKNLREFKLLWALSGSYNATSKFNVSTGKAVDGEMVTVDFSIPKFNWEATPDGTLFSAYIFANEESEDMGEIKLNFTTKQGQQNVTVPADLVPLLRNQHVKVSGNMMKESPIDDTEFDIVFDIDVEDWESANSDITTRPLAAKIGDFIYKDGTFGNEYNEKAIGVIFALKENFTDNSDYGTAFEGKKIAGYAMALEGTDRIYIGPSKDGGFTDGTDITTLATTETYNADYTVRTYNGYEYSKAFNAIFDNTEQSLLFKQYKGLRAKYNHTATNLSDWYIPSAHQMYDICARIYGISPEKNGPLDESTKNATLRAAYDIAVSSIGTPQAKLIGNATRSTWIMTSSFDKTQSKLSTLLVDNNFKFINSATTGSWALNSQYVLRPVLTIFEGE